MKTYFLILLCCLAGTYSVQAKDIDTVLVKHVVNKKFGTLYSIANYYNTTPAAIQQLNNMPNSVLQLGDTIQVEAIGVTFHMMDPIDQSVWRICQEYGADVDDILKHNKKKNANISIGERLVIPQKYQNATYDRYTYIKWGKTYQIEVRTLQMDNKNDHRIRWYKKRNNEWKVADELVVFSNGKFPQKSNEIVTITDVNKDGTPDVRIFEEQKNVYYLAKHKLYVIDYKQNKIQLD